jgi:hypothetical protein
LASIGQYLLPFICLAGAAVSAWRRHQRRALADNVAAATSADVLEGMSWREFELLVGEGFRRKGFQVEELGGAGADGGVDLVLRKGGEKHLVQCKQWRAYKVGVQVVRELYGVMAASGAAGGFVVTSGRFTEEAREFVKGRNVELMGGDALIALIRSARGAEHGGRSRSDEAKTQPEATYTSSASATPVCPRDAQGRWCEGLQGRARMPANPSGAAMRFPNAGVLRERKSRLRMKKLIVLVIVCLIGWKAYTHYEEKRQASHRLTAEKVWSPLPNSRPAAMSASFKCDGRTHC